MDIDWYRGQYKEYLNKLDTIENSLSFYEKVGMQEEHITNEQLNDERNSGTFKYYKKKLFVNFSNDNNNLGHLNGRFFTNSDDGIQTEISSVLDLRFFNKFDEYLNIIKKLYRKSAYYSYTRSLRENYYCHTFHRNNFLPDIVEINTSKEKRQNREMADNYKIPLEKFNWQSPDEILDINIEDSQEYNIYFGVFQKIDGYKLGNVITNEKLVG